ncbi:hypothetical protein CTEN210_12778 [Chaetoceros tenuissimus]|uniref:EXPERA domain-containing protein n=1 Tax=Chaetoceros tenuissimus TaxID=426638 RepID=A0AAD3D2B8_9STRA|nr:hypothetical protein CTEN210_12778 [Chaetoceros tenuissimus]
MYPTPLQNLLEFYTTTFNDQLMAAPHDTWFRAIVAGEFVFQFPFFFLVVHALLYPEKYDGTGWFKNLCLVYGAHTATTLIPILACHCDNESATLLEKVMVISIYLPYLIFPLWMVYICFVSQDIFGSLDKKKQ